MRPPDFAVGDDKKKGEIKERYTKSQLGYINISAIWTDFHKNWQGCRGS